VPIEASPPNLRDQVCGKNRRRPPAEEDDLETPAASASVDSGSPHQTKLSSLRPSGAKTSDLLGPWVDVIPPVVVYTGPKRDNVPEFAVAATPKRVVPKPAGEAKADSTAGRGRGATAGATSRASFTPPATGSATASPNLTIATDEHGRVRPHKKPARTAARAKPQTATIAVTADSKPVAAPKRTAKPVATPKPATKPKPIAAPKPAGEPKPAAAAPGNAPRASAPKPQAAAPRTAAVPKLVE